MAATNVQFAVATHIMAALAFYHDGEVNSRSLAESVNADPTFIRKSLSKLAKAGLVVTTRGKNGTCSLARSPKRITLRDIYVASEAPHAFAIHSYLVEENCPISSNMNACMSAIQAQTQLSFERALAKTTLAQVVADLRKRIKKSR